MACRGCPGLGLSDKLWSPENDLKNRYAGNFYDKHPVLARVSFVTVAFVSGAIKGLLFPLISAIQTLLFALLAIIKACRQKPESPDGPYWQAAALNFLGLSASVVFLVCSAYYLRISVASGIYLAGIATSITIHVYRACKAPEDVDDGSDADVAD